MTDCILSRPTSYDTRLAKAGTGVAAEQAAIFYDPDSADDIDDDDPDEDLDI